VKILAECEWWPNFVRDWKYKHMMNAWPVAGGVYDQAATFIEACEVFEELLREYQDE